MSTTETNHDHRMLSLQEKLLATAMARKIGDAATQYTIRNGRRTHNFSLIGDDELAALVDTYRQDPKESLAFARESLFAVAHDRGLGDETRDRRLDRYLDAYIDLTIYLDHEAFPNTLDREVRRGIPDYVPDGFIDMGGDSGLIPEHRKREQLWVDKKAMLNNHKEFLKGAFQYINPEEPLVERKKDIVAALMMYVYKEMPYNWDYVNERKNLGGDKFKMSEMGDGVCRHQAIVFQVLAQAMGIKSRLMKSYMDGERHATNAVRIDNQWRLIDVTNPDHVVKENGVREWRPASYLIDNIPKVGEVKQYEVNQKFSGKRILYTAHDDMFWRIEHTQ